MKTLRENLSNSGLALLDEENITENVIKAIEAEEAIKQARIQKHVPKWFQNIFREFAGVKNSKIHTDLKNGDLIYHRFTLKKTS
jgi:hypothetical protein